MSRVFMDMNREQFLELLTRKLQNGLSADEAEKFDGACHSSAEYAILAEQMLKKVPVRDELHDNALDHIWQRIAECEQTQNHSPVRRLIPGWMKVAATVLIFISAGWFTYHFLNRQAAEKILSLAATNQRLYYTLADGTAICLNRHSAIDYNSAFGQTKREITLHGEAFFDVARNPAVPLYIHAGQAIIQVKGTAFNVRQQAGQIAIALVRGHIIVSDPGHEPIALIPNQQLNISNGKFKVLPLDTILKAKATNWTLDTLVFKKQKLINLIALLERRYKVKIEIRNEQLKNRVFSGVIRNVGLIEVLDALRLSYPFSYVINNQVVIIK